MSFKISNDAQKWFNGLVYSKPQSPVMDAYYMCLILGLHMLLKDKKNKLPDRVVECMEYTFYKTAYPENYQGKKYEMIALFLEAELTRVAGDERSDKDFIKNIINSRLDSEDPSKLSEEGLGYADRYSYMGFLELKRKIVDKPYDKSIFLHSYYNVLKEYL